MSAELIVPNALDLQPVLNVYLDDMDLNVNTSVATFVQIVLALQTALNVSLVDTVHHVSHYVSWDVRVFYVIKKLEAAWMAVEKGITSVEETAYHARSNVNIVRIVGIAVCVILDITEALVK